MALRIPSSTEYIIREGDVGAEVYGVQTALATLGYQIVPDGSWGVLTTNVLGSFQEKNGIKKDGVCGPVTSKQLGIRLCNRSRYELPKGLLRGFMEAESGYMVGAVNWNVGGGVDCSYFQRRVLQASYNDDGAVKRAWDAGYQRDLLSRSVKSKHDSFYGQTGARTHELAWRLGALDHNYPYGAQKIAAVGIGGLTSYWTTPQKWVESIKSHFADGAPVRTPLEWCQKYSLGSKAHDDPGNVTQYVTDWST